jgi:hypothetical protein
MKTIKNQRFLVSQKPPVSVKAILSAILIMAVMLMAGCQTNNGCAAPMKIIAGECCLDENDNNICDKAEVVKEEQTITKETAAGIDARITTLLDKQSKLEGKYYYQKNYYEGTTNKITDTFKLWKMGDKMKQEYSGRIFYTDSTGIVYEYFSSKLNPQYKIVSTSMLKKDTYLLNLDGMTDVRVIEENYNQPIEGMLIGYTDQAGNKYKTYLWKTYGVPLEITKTTPAGDESTIKYMDTNTPVVKSDVTMPENATQITQ